MESPPPFIPEIYVDDNDVTSEFVVFLFFGLKKRERKSDVFLFFFKAGFSGGGGEIRPG